VVIVGTCEGVSVAAAVGVALGDGAWPRVGVAGVDTGVLLDDGVAVGVQLGVAAVSTGGGVSVGDGMLSDVTTRAAIRRDGRCAGG
jgi:hypothetical protein